MASPNVMKPSPCTPPPPELSKETKNSISSILVRWISLVQNKNGWVLGGHITPSSIHNRTSRHLRDWQLNHAERWASYVVSRTGLLGDLFCVVLNGYHWACQFFPIIDVQIVISRYPWMFSTYLITLVVRQHQKHSKYG